MCMMLCITRRRVFPLWSCKFPFLRVSALRLGRPCIKSCSSHRADLFLIFSGVFLSSDSKVHGADMGPTWVLSAPDGTYFGLMNLAIRGYPRSFFSDELPEDCVFGTSKCQQHFSQSRTVISIVILKRDISRIYNSIVHVFNHIYFVQQLVKISTVSRHNLHTCFINTEGGMLRFV